MSPVNTLIRCLFGCLLLMSVGCRPVTDADLEQRFSAKRGAFFTLAELVSSDPQLMRLTDDYADPVGIVSGEKLARYKELLRDLGLRGGLLRRDAGGPVFFVADSGGIAGHGFMKGVAYSAAELAASSAPLELQTASHGAAVYRALPTNHWYLFLIR